MGTGGNNSIRKLSICPMCYHTSRWQEGAWLFLVDPVGFKGKISATAYFLNIGALLDV